jgi:hypothetical protein
VLKQKYGGNTSDEIDRKAIDDREGKGVFKRRNTDN